MTGTLQSIKMDLLKIKAKSKLPQQLRIAEEHYHLRPAGIRVVIENTIEAIIHNLPVKEIDIFVFSDFENIFSVSDLKIRKKSPGKKINVHNVDIAELNYDPAPAKNKAEFLRTASKLKDQIAYSINYGKCNVNFETCDINTPFIFHLHGVPLGKNPYLCAAIWMLAEEYARQKRPVWFLNQVHDFAENSRPEMLKRMQKCTGKYDPVFAAKIMYPNTRNMFYATINSRDAENLQMIGIAPSRIFFLPNSIDTKFFTAKPITKEKQYKQQLLKRIKEYSKKNLYFFDEKKKILLSPLKLMRRKNNAETILLLMALNHFEDNYQLMITLEPGTGKDVDYANKIKEFIKINRLPVVIGLGNEFISQSEKRKRKGKRVEEFTLPDVFALSDAIFTTSIIEGFGFCFHEGWLTGKAVMGRKLPYVCNDFEKNGLDFKHLYKKLWVKLDWIKNAERRINEVYYKDANYLRKSQNMKIISKKSVKRYVSNIKFYKVGRDKCIDFKDLNLEMQLEAMGEIFADDKKIAKFIKLNPTIKRMHNMLMRKPKTLIEFNKKKVIEKYGLKAKAERLNSLFLVGNSNYLKKIKQKKASNQKVITKYLDLDYIHPLTVDKV